MDVSAYKLARTAELAKSTGKNRGETSVVKVMEAAKVGQVLDPKLDFEDDEEIKELIAMAEKSMQAEVREKLKSNHLINMVFNQLRKNQQKFILSYNVYPTKRPAPTTITRSFFQGNRKTGDSYHFDKADMMLRDRKVQFVMVNLYGLDAVIDIAAMDGIILTEKELSSLQESRHVTNEELTEFDRKVGEMDAVATCDMIINDPYASAADKLRATELKGKIMGFVVNKSESKNTNLNIDYVAMLEELDRRAEKSRMEKMKRAEVVESKPKELTHG